MVDNNEEDPYFVVRFERPKHRQNETIQLKKTDGLI